MENSHQTDITLIEDSEFSDYKKGEPQLLIATQIVTGSDDKKYILLKNPNDPRKIQFLAKPFDFQTEWVDKFKDGGKPMLVFVESYDKNTGKCMVNQYFNKVLDELYPRPELPKEDTFTILYKRIDPNTSKPYYQLKHSYGIQQRFYTEVELEVGKEIQLSVVDNIDEGNGKGHLVFQFSKPSGVKNPIQSTDPEESDFGNENTTTEFKRSIVFVPSVLEPDMDQQLKTIMKTIAGFLNREGGTIYVGVNDSGNVCGIETDFPHLNSSYTDSFVYKNNKDSYQLKIQNTIRKTLGTNSVLSFIDISFGEKRGFTYCVISIKPCPFPVFVNGTQLYQRMGNQTNLLKNEEITNFFRLKYNIDMAALPNDSITDEDGLSASEASQPTPEMEAELKSIKPAIHIEPEHFNPWRYIRLYTGGRWSWGKQPAKDRTDLLHETMIPKERKGKECVLLMCYANGCIDSVKLSNVIPQKEERIYSKGWLPENELLMVRAADPKEMIAFRAVGHNGEEYNKIHQAGVFGQHQELGGKGNIVVNAKQGVLVDVAIIPSNCGHQLGGFLTNRVPSQFLGSPRSDENRRDYLPLLDAVFAQFGSKKE